LVATYLRFWRRSRPYRLVYSFTTVLNSSRSPRSLSIQVSQFQGFMTGPKKLCNARAREPLCAFATDSRWGLAKGPTVYSTDNGLVFARGDLKHPCHCGKIVRHFGLLDAFTSGPSNVVL